MNKNKSHKVSFFPVLCIMLLLFFLLTAGGVLIFKIFFSTDSLFEKELSRRFMLGKVMCVDCQQNKNGDIMEVHTIQFEVTHEVFRRPKGIATWPDGGSSKYLIQLHKTFTWNIDNNILQDQLQKLPDVLVYDSTVDIFGYPSAEKSAWNGYKREVYFKESEFSSENDFLSHVFIQVTANRNSNQVKTLTARELGLSYK